MRTDAWPCSTATSSGACQVVVDIHSRFLFERALSSERRAGVLSVDRLRELMLDAQAAAYGDGVDPRTSATPTCGR